MRKLFTDLSHSDSNDFDSQDQLNDQNEFDLTLSKMHDTPKSGAEASRSGTSLLGGVKDGAGAGASALLNQTFNGTYYSFSGDQNTDAELIGSKWTSLFQTYSFPTSGSFYTGYTTGENTTGFQAFNAAQQTAVRYALNLVSQMTGVTFTEITETATTHALHRFGNTSLGSVGSAYGQFPSDNLVAGDVWFGLTNQPFYLTPDIGNWGQATIMHEIGHTMGLKHGHSDYTALNLASDLFIGGTRFGSRALTSNRDGQAYSLMTYRGAIGQPITFQGDGFNQPDTYMMQDIAALQYMYGANYTHNSGNNTYTFSKTTGEMFIDGVGQGAPAGNIVFRTVWDGGGNDTYDLSNYTTNMSLNLNAGGYMVFDTNAATHFQRANNQPLSGGPIYAPGNVANALLYQNNTASLIENAIGGTGNDIIIGNQADNILAGIAGNDTIFGGAGNDQLYGGTGADYLDGGIGFDYARYDFATAAVYVRLDTGLGYAGEALGDTLVGIEGIVGSNGNDTIVGDGGSNVIYGLEGNNALFGLDGNDYLIGGGGSDTLEGGAGADYLDGGAGFDFASYTYAGSGIYARLDTGAGLAGDALGDVLTNIEGLDGSSFNDTLVGSNGANVLYGRAGNDLMYGLAGDDYIIGGQGSDTMYGGAGNDGFVFDATDFQAGVQDLIMDFGVEAGNNDSIIFRFAPGTLIATEVDGGVAISTGALNYAGNLFIANTNINDVASHIVYA